MRIDNILHLGVKELWGLARESVLLGLILYVLTLLIYSSSTAAPDTLHNAPIAIVDEDQSPLSQRIIDAFYPPYFLPPKIVSREEVDTQMDAGLITFALDIPPKFQQDVLAGRSPTIQLNVDATRVGQAFSGSGYVQTIVNGEVQAFVQRYRSNARPPVDLEERVRFNPNLNRSWFTAVVEVINQITMLAMGLPGAALIRERERGTVEHLLVMPVIPVEIMMSKIWSMMLVVLVASAVSLIVVVQGLLAIPIQGSITLFMVGAALHLFACASLGIFLATFARTMPQFALLLLLVLSPLEMLSGGFTPRESMPQFVQNVMELAPTTHFVSISQAILFRGASLEVVWPRMLALAAIGTVFFLVARTRFRKSIGQLA